MDDVRIRSGRLLNHDLLQFCSQGCNDALRCMEQDDGVPGFDAEFLAEREVRSVGGHVERGLGFGLGAECVEQCTEFFRLCLRHSDMGGKRDDLLADALCVGIETVFVAHGLEIHDGRADDAAGPAVEEMNIFFLEF